MEKKRVALQGSYVDVYPQWPYPPFHAQALERGKHKREKKELWKYGVIQEYLLLRHSYFTFHI